MFLSQGADYSLGAYSSLLGALGTPSKSSHRSQADVSIVQSNVSNSIDFNNTSQLTCNCQFWKNILGPKQYLFIGWE